MEYVEGEVLWNFLKSCVLFILSKKDEQLHPQKSIIVT
jgi:hypothetical protein